MKDLGSLTTTRRARWADVPDLVGMIADLARHHGDVASIDRAALARLIADENAPLKILVAERAGALAGYAAVTPLAQLQHLRTGLELHHLYVAPQHRRQGVGRALVQAVRDMGVAQGAAYVALSADAGNIDAQAAYTALGFEQRASDTIRFGVRLG